LIDINEYFKKINYYIASCDEMYGIDTQYDYKDDIFSKPLKDDRINTSVYEMVNTEECFDGLLSSRSLTSYRREFKFKAGGGMGHYFNMKPSVYHMGDCGAPTYFTEDIPNLTIERLLEFYENMNLDFGITLDHIVDMLDLTNKETPSDVHVFRRKWSCDNAIKMLELVKKKKSNVYLIGSVQGWSPESYRDSLIQLGEAGFKYCAIGGLTLAGICTDVTHQLLHYLKPDIDRFGMKVHLLGFGRVSLLGSLKKLNVITSFDNSTPLLNAANSPTSSYFFHEKGHFKKYTSLYIPMLSRGGPTIHKKLAKHNDNPVDLADDLDERSEKLVYKLHEFDNDIDNNDLLNELISDIRDYELHYRSLIKGEYSDLKMYMEEVKLLLESRIWKKCDCEMCRDYGINVIMFRAQIRNKLRGIHNLKHYYNWIQYEINKEDKMDSFLE
jgi:hypothetical protein